MEAVFFVADRGQALGVSAWDDLPGEPAAEPLRIPSPRVLVALSQLVCGQEEPAVAPLRDATCRSFPVWVFEPEFCDLLAGMSESTIDAVAERWLADANCQGLDADLYELSTLLTDLRRSLREDLPPPRQLFALLQETVL